MTAEEVAAYLGLTGKFAKNTVMRWVRTKKIPGAKIGKFYRFRKSDIDRTIFSQ